VKGLTTTESTYLSSVRHHSGSYAEPHVVLRGESPEEAELSGRMVRRGLLVFLRCVDPSCAWYHPHLTELGRTALQIDTIYKMGYTP
jgi:hypothetical protein